MIPISIAAILLMQGPQGTSPLDTAYRQMYNLEFAGAHRTLAEWEHARPDDPLGPASNAAAYLFAEFDRLRILQSEFFTDDDAFKHRAKLSPDPVARRAFDAEMEKAARIAGQVLARSPQDKNALFASILNLGLRADYDALVDKRYMASLEDMKEGRGIAEKLLALDPGYGDANLAIGVENYSLSLKPAPLRWLLQLGGAQTGRDVGLEKIRLTAEEGHYLKPYARLLLAVAALRDKNPEAAKGILRELTHEFPGNRLYSEELAKLK